MAPDRTLARILLAASLVELRADSDAVILGGITRCLAVNRRLDPALVSQCISELSAEMHIPVSFTTHDITAISRLYQGAYESVEVG